MTSSTDETLANIFKSINPESSESDVEKKIVIRLLHLLGYNDADWRSQFVIGKFKLDFLVRPQGSTLSNPPFLAIEVKAAKEKIEHKSWQISQYMRHSGAIIGLLTNGYQFHLFYNYKSKIVPLLEYNQFTLIEKYSLFHQILAKETCLRLNQAFYQNQQQIRYKFANFIAQKLSIEDLLLTLSRSPNSQLDAKATSSSKTQIDEDYVVNTNESEERKPMIITIFNNKGGVGKTTMTINLAAALNKLGKRVLLIDIDAQANLTMGLGIDPLNDVENLGKKDISYLLTEPRTSLEETIIRKRWDDVQIDIVPSHIRLSDMEPTMIMTPDIDRILVKKLKKYRDEYDYVLIDPPPSFGKANIIAMMAASAVLIPTQLAAYPIRALEYVIGRAIAFDKAKDEPMPILGIAVSMYDRVATKIALNMNDQIAEILAKIPDAKNVEVWPQKTWIPNLTIVATTPTKGYPLCFAEFDQELNSRDKEAAQDAFSCYTKLAKHLISVTNV